MSLPIHSHCKNGLMYEVTNAVPNTMKTTVAYVEMARLARELLENANIRAIITDFEQPLRTAFREAFHNSHLVGCYFHHIRYFLASNYSVFGIENRTNNAIESYHGQLLRTMNDPLPLWTWIEKMKQIVLNVWNDIESMENNQCVRQPKATTI
ncbi:hypothetical protein TKK_0013193 [Trichogramma kaykai]